MKILVAYEQGALDSLCGVYSLINAMRILIKDLDYKEAERVFRRILRYVESKKRLSSVITGGIGDRDVFNIARTVLHVKYNISIRRLYGDDQKPPVSKIVAKMAKLLRDENVAIIISIEAPSLPRITPSSKRSPIPPKPWSMPLWNSTSKPCARPIT